MYFHIDFLNLRILPQNKNYQLNSVGILAPCPQLHTQADNKLLVLHSYLHPMATYMARCLHNCPSARQLCQDRGSFLVKLNWTNTERVLDFTPSFKHYIIQFSTHWGRVTHLCVSKLTIIGSNNGLSPGRRQAVIRTNAGILLLRPLVTNFNEMLIEILTFLFMKTRLKVSSAKWHPFCLGLNVLNWKSM